MAAVCGVVLAVLTACGSGGDPDAGTNGVGKLSAASIQAKTLAAADHAASVRLAGNVISAGRLYKLDMRLTSGGGTGEVASKGSTFVLLRVGEDLYLKADGDFWLKQGKAQAGAKDGEPSKGDIEAAKKLDGKYVKVPAGDTSYRQLSGFTDMRVLLDGLVKLHGSLDTGDHGKVDGTKTIRISGDKGRGGQLDVSLEGKPYPLRLQRAGHAGVVRLGQWDDDFAVKAPRKDDVVDYGKAVKAG